MDHKAKQTADMLAWLLIMLTGGIAVPLLNPIAAVVLVLASVLARYPQRLHAWLSDRLQVVTKVRIRR